MPKGKHLPRVIVNCRHCGIEFSRVGSDTDRVYCSAACARASKTAQPKRQFVCEWCGKRAATTVHHGRQRFCSVSCGRRSFNAERKELNREARQWIYVREAKADLLKEVGKCEACGWASLPDILELHHLDRNRRNNRRANLKLLCPTCHTMLHFLAKTGQFHQIAAK
jgi:hypothetical protein